MVAGWSKSHSDDWFGGGAMALAVLVLGTALAVAVIFTIQAFLRRERLAILSLAGVPAAALFLWLLHTLGAFR